MIFHLTPLVFVSTIPASKFLVYAGIAQVVEQKTENLCVVGSTPSPGTSLRASVDCPS